jgi:predicted flavoprotein YhiN
MLDLLPARSAEWIAQELAHPRGTRSFATHLNTRLNLKGVKLALIHETEPQAASLTPERLAALIKALPISLSSARPIAEAISSAGGVKLESLTPQLMSHELPGVFCAGEMLDWEAPTGGYLLTAAMASGLVVGQGVLAYLR